MFYYSASEEQHEQGFRESQTHREKVREGELKYFGIVMGIQEVTRYNTLKNTAINSFSIIILHAPWIDFRLAQYC